MSKEFGLLHPRLQESIIDKMGWKSLRPVQNESISSILEGNNVIIQAATAGGKTEAAFFPILSLMQEENLLPLSCIYISPIRALLNNQEYRLKKLGSLIGIDAFKWHGEVVTSEKKKFKISPAHIMATTPESLEVLLMNVEKCNGDLLFGNLRFMVIDEIHYFATNDRGIQLLSIIERIQKYSQYDIQRIGLSATIGNPKEVLGWMQGSSNREQQWIKPEEANSKKNIRLFVRYMEEWTEEILEEKVIPVIKGQKSLFFSDSRSIAEKVADSINLLGIKSRLHHSSISKIHREYTEELLQKGEEVMVACTSTMELGIDVGDLDVILQYNAPNTVASFLQRLGRTGRRDGKVAHYEFLTVNKEALLRAISIIELAREKWVESVDFPNVSYQVLIQQIFSTIREKSGATFYDFDKLIKNQLNVKNITISKLEALISEMVMNNHINIVDGLYFLSDELEEHFGKRNFLDLCSVFETFPEFIVKFQNRDIGSLDTWFVLAHYKESEPFPFVLNGQVWKAIAVDKERYIIHVEQAVKGTIPNWSGSSQPTSFTMAQKILTVLSSYTEFPYIDNDAAEKLKQFRTDFQYFGMKPGILVIEQNAKGFIIHTFAGDKVNYTLNLFLKYMTGAEVKSNYQNISFKLSDYPWEKLEQLMIQIVEIKEEKLLELIEYVGELKLAKFQKYLPKFAENEYLAEQLFDLETLKYYLSSMEYDWRLL